MPLYTDVNYEPLRNGHVELQTTDGVHHRIDIDRSGFCPAVTYDHPISKASAYDQSGVIIWMTDDYQACVERWNNASR